VHKPHPKQPTQPLSS
jgi:septal ring factor EnvC (AmiA/AmiB activator)